MEWIPSLSDRIHATFGRPWWAAEPELSWLDAAAGGGARGGGAAVVAVEGEAGIGKSALVRVGGRGSPTWWCWRPAATRSARDLPLQPVLEAVDRHLAALGAEAAAVLGPDAATWSAAS